MSLNRYFYICRQDDYRTIFRQRNCVLFCLTFYGTGIFIVILNTADIGDHSFDRKSLECIWDRMATFPYTIVFTIALVWLPLVVTGTCYLRIFAYVRAQRRKIAEHNELSGAIVNSHRKQKVQLAKTLFLIYAVFMTCWVPYALLIVIDSKDTFAHQLHVFSTAFAHLHPSLNWLIYYLTNKRFAKAYRYILSCGKQNVISPDHATAMSEMNHAPPQKVWQNWYEWTTLCGVQQREDERWKEKKKKKKKKKRKCSLKLVTVKEISQFGNERSKVIHALKSLYLVIEVKDKVKWKEKADFLTFDSDTEVFCFL